MALMRVWGACICLRISASSRWRLLSSRESLVNSKVRGSAGGASESRRARPEMCSPSASQTSSRPRARSRRPSTLVEASWALCPIAPARCSSASALRSSSRSSSSLQAPRRAFRSAASARRRSTSRAASAACAASASRTRWRLASSCRASSAGSCLTSLLGPRATAGLASGVSGGFFWRSACSAFSRTSISWFLLRMSWSTCTPLLAKSSSSSSNCSTEGLIASSLSARPPVTWFSTCLRSAGSAQVLMRIPETA
mmetsp:Transcript_124197/g.362482  ORF Transcript_124197/g.362482 Transcript_124197/m.362482 type:complete len:255 (-) Transcript_124197:574-1338(-)